MGEETPSSVKNVPRRSPVAGLVSGIQFDVREAVNSPPMKFATVLAAAAMRAVLRACSRMVVRIVIIW